MTPSKPKASHKFLAFLEITSTLECDNGLACKRLVNREYKSGIQTELPQKPVLFVGPLIFSC